MKSRFCFCGHPSWHHSFRKARFHVRTRLRFSVPEELHHQQFSLSLQVVSRLPPRQCATDDLDSWNWKKWGQWSNWQQKEVVNPVNPCKLRSRNSNPLFQSSGKAQTMSLTVLFALISCCAECNAHCTSSLLTARSESHVHRRGNQAMGV